MSSSGTNGTINTGIGSPILVSDLADLREGLDRSRYNSTSMYSFRTVAQVKIIEAKINRSHKWQLICPYNSEKSIECLTTKKIPMTKLSTIKDNDFIQVLCRFEPHFSGDKVELRATGIEIVEMDVENFVYNVFINEVEFYKNITESENILYDEYVNMMSTLNCIHLITKHGDDESSSGFSSVSNDGHTTLRSRNVQSLSSGLYKIKNPTSIAAQMVSNNCNIPTVSRSNKRTHQDNSQEEVMAKIAKNEEQKIMLITRVIKKITGSKEDKSFSPHELIPFGFELPVIMNVIADLFMIIKMSGVNGDIETNEGVNENAGLYRFEDIQNIWTSVRKNKEFDTAKKRRMHELSKYFNFELNRARYEDLYEECNVIYKNERRKKDPNHSCVDLYLFFRNNRIGSKTPVMRNVNEIINEASQLPRKRSSGNFSITNDRSFASLNTSNVSVRSPHNRSFENGNDYVQVTRSNFNFEHSYNEAAGIVHDIDLQNRMNSFDAIESNIAEVELNKEAIENLESNLNPILQEDNCACLDTSKHKKKREKKFITLEDHFKNILPDADELFDFLQEKSNEIIKRPGYWDKKNIKKEMNLNFDNNRIYKIVWDETLYMAKNIGTCLVKEKVIKFTEENVQFEEYTLQYLERFIGGYRYMFHRMGESPENYLEFSKIFPIAVCMFHCPKRYTDSSFIKEIILKMQSKKKDEKEMAEARLNEALADTNRWSNSTLDVTTSSDFLVNNLNMQRAIEDNFQVNNDDLDNAQHYFLRSAILAKICDDECPKLESKFMLLFLTIIFALQKKHNTMKNIFKVIDYMEEINFIGQMDKYFRCYARLRGFYRRFNEIISQVKWIKSVYVHRNGHQIHNFTNFSQNVKKLIEKKT
uniref:Uncharacterized protein n=1 Tax=Parastrongyloides trichosuri TaxID=131310 RepID=A0A0N4Z7F9_PARTI